MLSSSQKNRKSLSPEAPKPRCDTGEADLGSPTRDVAAEQRADPHGGATGGAGSRVKAGTPHSLHSPAHTCVALGRRIKPAQGLRVTFFPTFRSQQSGKQDGKADRIWIKLLARLRRDER